MIINTKITNVVARVNLQSKTSISIISLVQRKDKAEKIIKDKNKDIKVVEKVSFFDSILNSLSTMAYTKKPGNT